MMHYLLSWTKVPTETKLLGVVRGHLATSFWDGMFQLSTAMLNCSNEKIMTITGKHEMLCTPTLSTTTLLVARERVSVESPCGSCHARKVGITTRIFIIQEPTSPPCTVPCLAWSLLTRTEGALDGYTYGRSEYDFNQAMRIDVWWIWLIHYTLCWLILVQMVVKMNIFEMAIVWRNHVAFRGLNMDRHKSITYAYNASLLIPLQKLKLINTDFKLMLMM